MPDATPDTALAATLDAAPGATLDAGPGAGLAPPLRLAVEADAPVLARLLYEASHGLALVAWTQMAGPDEDPWAVGAARQAARAGDGLWVVVDEGAGPLAGLLAFPPETAPPGPDAPPLFRPLIELEALAPDALYVNVLATLPGARGRGLGSLLLRHAEAIARAGGRRQLSLIVADDNDGARRLYARTGFREVARRPMVEDGWDGGGADWILMVSELA